ncbi:hypothetical protein V8C34DRAFT_324467 [Trichoderma compactum]
MPQKQKQNENSLFAKLPPEIRCKIWHMLLVERKVPITPVHIPRDTGSETFFTIEKNQSIILALDALLKTCRLFYQDQEDYMVFYMFNEFRFPRSRDCLAYVAAITPSRRNAIRNITISGQLVYDGYGVRKKKPGDRLRTIAKLCPNLRVLRHEKFFYRADSLTNWATLLSETLKPIVAALPLLDEIHIRGGIRREDTLWECHMTLQSISFASKTSFSTLPYWTARCTKCNEPGENGEKLLKAVWEILSKRRTVQEPPLQPHRVKRAIATTPILTLGQDRRRPNRINGARQNVRRPTRATVPDFILEGLGTVKDIRFPRDQSSPDLLIGTVWYPWDAIFESHRLSEYHSKWYVAHALYRFKKRKRLLDWIY